MPGTPVYQQVDVPLGYDDQGPLVKQVGYAGISGNNFLK